MEEVRSLIEAAWEQLKKMASQQTAIGATPTHDEARAAVGKALQDLGIAPTDLSDEAIEYFASEYLAMIGRRKKDIEPVWSALSFVTSDMHTGVPPESAALCDPKRIESIKTSEPLFVCA